MKKSRSRRRANSNKNTKRSNRLPALMLGLVFSVTLAGIIFAGSRSIRLLSSHPMAGPQSTPTPQLSKEYIYAGGKLIAIEEPNGTSPLSAPAGLIATGNGAPQVNLSWAASTGGTVDHYQVERCHTFGANCYTMVANNVSPTSPTINYTDTSVTAGTAYLYRVLAVDSSGLFSSPSTVDLSTATTFTDDPLVSGVTPVKAQHLTELRLTINAVRTLANLSAASWTDDSPQGVWIKAVHVQEMRTALDQALLALGMSAPSYTDPTLSSAISIQRIHFDELRQAVK